MKQQLDQLFHSHFSRWVIAAYYTCVSSKTSVVYSAWAGAPICSCAWGQMSAAKACLRSPFAYWKRVDFAWLHTEHQPVFISYVWIKGLQLSSACLLAHVELLRQELLGILIVSRVFHRFLVYPAVYQVTHRRTIFWCLTGAHCILWSDEFCIIVLNIVPPSQ